jgi:hypothetical protein
MCALIMAGVMAPLPTWESAHAAAGPSGQTGRGGPGDVQARGGHPADCIAPEQRAGIEKRLREREAKRAAAGETAKTSGTQPYPFLPQAGTLWEDISIPYYTDMDPAPGAISDFDCTGHTYDGHNGHDISIRSFREQQIGVPVFAALDGTVFEAHDGEPDMNVDGPDVPTNYVAIDHGGGHLTYYFHLKRDSVAVSAGQPVAAGTQIGLVGSSGRSYGPHTHFSSFIDGTWYEPNAGSCRPGPSDWVNQIPIRRDLYAWDFHFGPERFDNYAPLPFDDAPRTGAFVGGTPGWRDVFFRVGIGDLPANAAWRTVIKRPDGSVAIDFSDTFSPEPVEFSQVFWFWWVLELNVTGTWRVLFEVNGQQVADAPFDVVSSASQIVNRPPSAIATAFEPALPVADDVVFCRVQTDPLREDPDYDIVHYRYQWSVNGAVVRDVTNAALSDAIPKGTLQAGDVLSCTVTPSDGTLSGPPSTSSVSVTGSSGVLQFGAVSFSAAESAGSASIVVTRTGGISGPASVSYTTSDNTATAGADYAAASGSLAFAPGEASKTFSVPITNDASPEGNESLNLTLSAPSGATLGHDRRALLTIADNDAAGTLQFSAVNTSVAETTASKAITVSRTGGSSGPVSVTWSAASNTATLGADFTAPGGSLTFGPGQTSRTFTVTIANDVAQEGNESAHLTLTNPMGGAVLGARSRSILTITDNDVPASGFKFSAATYSRTESGSAAITIQRTSSASAQAVTVATSNNGTAAVGADYTAVTQTVSFAAGQASKTVSVPILADTLVEGNESVNLTLSNPTNGGTLGAQRTAVLTITDDDTTATLQFQSGVYTVSEAGPGALVTVTRTGGTGGAVTVSYATSANTAVAGDYTSATGVVSFGPGQTSASFSVAIADDAMVEGSESVNLMLTGPTGGAVLGQGVRAVLVITDND